jgi:SPP1 gp7 family putative phage head morphogenesis protein
VAKSSKQLTTIATRHQVFLERLKAGEVRGFTGVVAKLDRAIRDVLNALDNVSMSELSRKKLNALLVELEAASTMVLEKASTEMLAKLETLAGYEAAFEGRSLQQAARGSTVKFAVPDAGTAYKAALAQPLSATGQTLKGFFGDWSKGEVVRLNNVVRRAWGEGWTVQQLTQSIRGTKALNFKDGILATTRRNAEAIARTSIQHVASMGRQATWQENSDIVSGYKYVATLDARTTSTCRSLDGQTFKLGEGPVPPVHINCRSTTVADIPELSFLDKGATRASKDGPVDADQTYYEWLKGQPANFQDEALGPQRAALFRDGGLSADKFAQLNLGRDFQPLTLAEMQKLEPLAFERAGLD